MVLEYEQFLKIAEKHLGYFSFMVWDYYKFPEFFELKIINDTLLCKYENFMLFYGKPDKRIFEGLNLKGELFISFQPDWISLIQENFFDFELVVKINEVDKINKFLCMELLEENFIPEEQYQSRKLERKDLDVLGIQRRIHQSRGFGGVGIIKDDSLLGCAFASQVVQEKPFSFSIIRDVWVSPNLRNQGLGSDLTSHISKVIFEQQVERIFLWVEERNYPAVHLYENLGFTTVDNFLSTVCKFMNN
ncbi:MAG: GNAT family N-acetyltransferase [Candidatus Heimdallarchaeaceae archaeon]|jgi:ribosomal protein S18 acetylase RimI-like enzyme